MYKKNYWCIAETHCNLISDLDIVFNFCIKYINHSNIVVEFILKKFKLSCFSPHLLKINNKANYKIFLYFITIKVNCKKID